MKFSIVITTYNRLPLLKRAVESALAQTLPCEVVIADDGSSDGTQEYAKSLGDRVVYHRNLINLGHSATINAAVSVATGEWIKLLDDDDYLAPNCLEEMAEAIAGCPQAAICSCQAIQVNTNGAEVSRTQLYGPSKAFYIPQEDIHYGMFLEIVPFGTPVQVAFKKEAFLRSGGWNSRFDGNYDDIYSWIKIAQYGDAVFVNQYLAYRMIWPGSCHKKLSLQQRLDMNILIKAEIYSLVPSQYRLLLPTMQEISDYLRLHWCLVGLKQEKSVYTLKLANKALFSPKAWMFLCTTAYSRKVHSKTSQIRQLAIPPVERFTRKVVIA